MGTAPQQQPIVRLDKSRDFATVHGDRPPGDPHLNVGFYQNGLPYNYEEKLIADHPEVERDPKKKELAEKLLKRAAKQAKNKVATAENSGDPLNLNDPKAPVNLSAWARGEQDVVWQEVTNAIARRFAVRVGNKRDALELLLEEKIVAKNDLSDEHLKLLDID